MAKNELNQKEPKQEKNIKHGALALTALGITFILIIIGAYFYGQHYGEKAPVKPMETNQINS